MGEETITIKKSWIVAGLVALVFLSVLILLVTSQNNIEVENSDLKNLDVETRFSILSQQRTNSCGGGKSYVSQLSEDGTRIRGSCCSPMNLHSYGEQIEGLKEYSEHEIIPADPYDVPAKWAEEMIEYNGETQLSYEKQIVYDEAVEISYEGGPCCCKCWHWYAYEGLAKFLIINEDFSAEQIAEVWDLSDACGGEHHNHGHDEGSHGH